NNYSRVAISNPLLMFLLPGTESILSLFKNERADPVRAFRFVRDRHRHAIICVLAIGRKSFRAVEQPMIAVTHSGRSRPARVRTRLRLGQRPRTNRLPRS